MKLYESIKDILKENQINESLSDGREVKTYEVAIGFCGMIGVEEEYRVQAFNRADAVCEALDNPGSEAELDLSVENVEDHEDGSYTVTVNFAGFIGADNDYEVYADDEDSAKEQALEDAKADLEVISVDGKEFSYDDPTNMIEAEEPEEDKKLDMKERVLKAYDNCSYSLRADMPTIKDILRYLDLSDTGDNRNLVANIIYKAGKDWQIEEAANPENAEANALIKQALDDKEFAAAHKDELEKLGLRVDVNTYTNGSGETTVSDVYLTGPNGRKLKSAWRNYDNTTHDYEPNKEAYFKDGINQYDSKTDEYKNLKDLDNDFTLSRKTYGDSKQRISSAKEELPRLKKRLSLYAKRYGENSSKYRQLQHEIDSLESTVKNGVQPKYSSNTSKDVDYLNYLNKPFRSDREQARKTYSPYGLNSEPVASSNNGTEIDVANERSRKYKKLKDYKAYNDRQKEDNLRRDKEDEERVQDIIKRNKEEKDRRDSITDRADKRINKDFADIKAYMDAHRK